MLLQLAHATLSRVFLDDGLKGSLVELNLRGVFVESCIVQLTRHQVTLGNLYLLLGDVTAHLDEFHTVEQWTRDGAEVVGSGDEEYLRQVVVDVEIVVVERLVLLWVEYFKKCRRRVAVEVGLCYLVYFVKDEHRVGTSCLLDVLDDASQHSSDVSTAMTTNLSLVVQTAQ